MKACMRIENTGRRSPDVDPRPYEVQIDGAARSRFSDLRDAISAARLVRRDRPFSRIEVLVPSSGAFVVGID